MENRESEIKGVEAEYKRNRGKFCGTEKNRGGRKKT